MNRRSFLIATALGAKLARQAGAAPQEPPPEHRLPHTDSNYRRVHDYVEEVPVPEYHWAPEHAYEAFRNMKYGVRIHWGLYSIRQQPKESWPFLTMSNAERASYNQLYKTWNPAGFDAAEWMNLFQEAQMKMFAFTSKHHEGFSMFDTKTRVRRRVNWAAPGGPKLEDCDLAYSIMETPFRRDVVKELCAAAHQRGIKVDLYFSHPDWYDADFRPYGSHPLQVPSSAHPNANQIVVPEPTPAEVNRMMQRHRAQLVELLTKYGHIDMLCLDIELGPKVWPQLRETVLKLREIQPNVMLRARGIGNYGDYYTPERFIPGTSQTSTMPWFVIYPLGSDFSYEKEASNYKGAQWIITNLIDSAAKGGGFMVGVGPDGNGRFHPTAIEQLKQAGAWLKVNGEGIFGTRARDGELWRESEKVRFTRAADHRFVYAFALEWPGSSLTLTTVKARQVHLLGYPEPLRWRNDAQRGLVIDLPPQRPGQLAWCFRIEPQQPA